MACCIHCSHPLPADARFCPQCGRSQAVRPRPPLKLTPRAIAAIAAAAAALWAGAWFGSASLAGVKPARHFEDEQTQSIPASDEIASLRKVARAAPQSIPAGKALASALMLQLQHAPSPDAQHIFDLIDALAHVLRLDPKDAEALLAMADLSYDRQVYDKAASYYARYLDVAPDNPDARARYASTLAYGGNFSDAQRELESVLAKNPEHFVALAYLAVTLAQLGEREKSLAAGERALKLAPEGEARTQLADFVERVRRGDMPAGAAQTESTLKIGALLSLTGPLGFIGEDFRDGFQLCARGRLPLILEDHQAQPAIAVSAFNKLVNINHIDFGIVMFTNVSSAIVPAARRKNIPLLLSGVSSGKLAALGGGMAVNFFATGEQDGPIMADYLYRHRRVRRAAVLHFDGDFGLSYRDSFTAAFERAGGSIVFHDSFLPATSDYRAPLAKIGAAGAQALYFIGYDSHILDILRQARELKLPALLAGTWLASAPPLRQGRAEIFEGVLCTAPEFYTATAPLAESFKRDYLQRFHRPPTAYSGIGCDSAELLSELRERTPDEAMKALRSLKRYAGVMGTLNANPDGNIIFPLSPVEISGGVLRAARTAP